MKRFSCCVSVLFLFYFNCVGTCKTESTQSMHRSESPVRHTEWYGVTDVNRCAMQTGTSSTSVVVVGGGSVSAHAR